VITTQHMGTLGLLRTGAYLICLDHVTIATPFPPNPVPPVTDKYNESKLYSQNVRDWLHDYFAQTKQCIRKACNSSKIGICVHLMLHSAMIAAKHKACKDEGRL